MADTRIKTAVGPTILLQGGTYFDLLDPANSPFTIEDIAHGLAHTCRFAGQCSRFYSVAEHCVLASHVAAPEFALRTLMHDAAEAFTGDVTRPLKSILPAYKAIERTIEAAIAERFKIGDWNVAEVKAVDLEMLAAEQQMMMPAIIDNWAVLAGVTPAPIEFAFWRPHTARQAFLDRYAELTGWGDPAGLERGPQNHLASGASKAAALAAKPKPSLVASPAGGLPSHVGQPGWRAVIRHLIPRAEWNTWCGDALTYDPNGGVELPVGFMRSMRIAQRLPTTTPERDEVVGRTLCIQWFGLMVELSIGRVR